MGRGVEAVGAGEAARVAIDTCLKRIGGMVAFGCGVFLHGLKESARRGLFENKKETDDKVYNNVCCDWFAC
jgi:hypothetical protein